MKEDWIECTFKELTLSLKRGPFGGDLKKSFFVESGFPVYEQQHAINDDYSNIRYFIDDERFEKLKACNVGPGDYIVSCSGTMGKISRIPNNVPKGVINQALLRIRLNDEIMLHNYFIQYFKSSLFQKKILKDSRGSGMQNMAGIKELKPIPISIPPLVEQKAIVKKIEELFSSLDSGIADLTKAQDQLVIYRQAVLKKAFEGELTKEWREKQNNLTSADELLEQIKEERQKHYDEQLADWKVIVKSWEKKGKEGKKPSKPQKPTNLDQKIIILDEVASSLNVSDTWNIQPLAFISDNKPNCIVDGPFGSSINVAEDYKETGVPVIRMVNIRPFKYVSQNLKFIVKEKFNQLKRHNILSKDILIAKVGATIGDCCIYPSNQPEGMLSTTGSCRVRLDSNIYLPELLQYYIFFQKYKLKSIASQTAQPFLNMKVLKSYPIPFLPIQEQHLLIREIESRLSVCDTVEKDIADSLEKAQALRQSILKKAFEGKLLSEAEIAKCKADKNYEPASVLLQKIKAEKKKK